MKMKKEVNRVLLYYSVIGVMVAFLGLGAISEAAPPIKLGLVSAWDLPVVVA
jgi:TPP-dependent pyruvate/acetoin dehydrogenase alpha subunit